MKLLLVLIAVLLFLAGALGLGPVPALYVFSIIVLAAAILS